MVCWRSPTGLPVRVLRIRNVAWPESAEGVRLRAGVEVPAADVSECRAVGSGCEVSQVIPFTVDADVVGQPCSRARLKVGSHYVDRSGRAIVGAAAAGEK